MATIARKTLKLGAVVGTVPAACIALGYRMRAVQASENSGQEGSRVYKACDLPIYNVVNNKGEPTSAEAPARNAVEEQIGNIRLSLQDFVEQYKGTYEEAKHTIDVGVEHSKSTLDFVQNNPGELPRVAFITVGSLGGFILGYRGGVFRKLFYGTVAGVSCAALCYPTYTMGISREVAGSVVEGWSTFSSEELMKGNWPFVQNESTDEENRRKLNLTKNLSGGPQEVSNVIAHEATTKAAASIIQEVVQSAEASKETPPVPAPTPAVLLKGDPGQSNPDDKDMYSTRSS